MAHFFSCFLILTNILSVSAFSYDRCDNTNGPTAWGGQCGTSLLPQGEGTPINLCGARAFPGVAPKLVASNYGSQTATLENNGKTVELVMNPTTTTPAATLNAGSLANIVGRTTNPTTATVWRLQQIHFHWGRNANEGSEHYLQGKQHPMEAHLVHFNTAYGNSVAEVLANPNRKEADALLVVGVFLTVPATATTAAPFPLMETIAQNMVLTPTTPAASLGTVSLTGLFDGTGAYYSYRGSLTTPMCNELVTWVVMQQPKVMPSAVLAEFYKAQNTLGQAYSLYGNYRPLQSRNVLTRALYTSTGTDAICPLLLGPTQPSFKCSLVSLTLTLGGKEYKKA